MQHFDLGRLDEGVDGEGRARFALAPRAMAAMHDDRLGLQAIAQRTAGAAAVQAGMSFIAHDRSPLPVAPFFRALRVPVTLDPKAYHYHFDAGARRFAP
jgi:hypothetical protein